MKGVLLRSAERKKNKKLPWLSQCCNLIDIARTQADTKKKIKCSNAQTRENKSECVGVTKIKELKLQETDASHALGGAIYVGIFVFIDQSPNSEQSPSSEESLLREQSLHRGLKPS